MAFSTIRPRTFFHAAAIALSTLVLGSSSGFAQKAETVRVRGIIVSLDGSMLTVKSRQGADVSIKLADNFRVASVVKASAADIEPGVFIGTASVSKAGELARAGGFGFPRGFARHGRG